MRLMRCLRLGFSDTRMAVLRWLVGAGRATDTSRQRDHRDDTLILIILADSLHPLFDAFLTNTHSLTDTPSDLLTY
jgi:hypothetical protein